MTIHGSKSELKRLRYLENHVERISRLPDAITFDPTVGISISLVFQKLYIQNFLGTPREAQSESRKAFKQVIKVRREKDEIANVSLVNTAATMWLQSLRKRAKSLFNPPNPQISKTVNFGNFGEIFYANSLFLSLFLSKFSPKHVQKLLISLFPQQSRGSVLALFFLGLRTLDLRF